MKDTKKIRGIWWIILTILSVGLLLWSGLWLAEDGQRQGLPSLYSVDDSGYMAVYRLLKRHFTKVYPGESGLELQFQSKPGIFITARPNWLVTERSMANRWMERGGIIILLTPLAEERSAQRPQRVASIHPAWEGFSDLPALPLKPSPGLTVRPTDQALYRSAHGPEVGIRQVGQGRRIVFGSSHWFTNGSLLDRPQPAAALIKLVAVYHRKGERIIWDESFNIPRVQRRFKIPKALLWAGFQILLLGIFYALTRGRRLGPPLSLEIDTPLTLRDYLLSLAGFYRKARGRRLVLEQLFTNLRLCLLRRTGLSPSVEDSRLAEVYGGIGGVDPETLTLLMADCRRYLAGAALDEKTFYQLGKTIDRYRKELERHGKR